MPPRQRILVVDDEIVTLQMLTDMLQASGFEILTAQDGTEGLARARTERPDLIIVDVMMPKLDGFKMCRLLKSDRKYRHIPIIILTAKAGQVDRELSLQAGADRYVVKPVPPYFMLAHVKELLAPPPGEGTEGSG